MTPSQREASARQIPTVVKDQELVQRRRRQIADAAVSLFLQKGFHKTTTREIAKSAGISIGSLYEYVQTKEDVLYLVCQAIHQEMEQSLQAHIAHGGSGARALESAIQAYIAACDGMGRHITFIYQETKSLPAESKRYVLEHELRITGMFIGLLRRGVEDYSLRPLNRGEIELMAHNIMVLGHMWAFRHWALAGIGLAKYIEDQSALLMGQLV
ncbi:transcriptional regulator, TetR family [Desulfarculus baarsii DSM 2075]|uniref:Transcriptional regulator, TetR family n=1 Tax=Desulfarculus baarsii (strain ATCC 33931 / DSM 2075 / LMG 7858 / VKM B-1802 / 2st14) TaxID=644282 RepID=E1QF13_DESB2|nr:TetR/AcrR family transcriptional regulator [Desulfarculus baarsii]ADK84149.1 transcriptional regulator, TetR family [Desulfarculus baarsii DSM 2075]